MFRQILGSRIFVQNAEVRLRNLRAYVCLRDAQNDQSSQRLKDLATKYNVETQELVEALKLIQLSKLDQSSNFPNYEDYNKQTAFLREEFINNRFSNLSNNLSHTAQVLRFKYPELVKYKNTELTFYSLKSETRQKAVQELEQLFLVNGPIVNNFISKDYGNSFLSEYEKRVEELVASLQGEHVDAIRSTLNQIVQDYSENPGLQIINPSLNNIQSFVDAELGRSEPVEKQVQVRANAYLAELVARKFAKEDQEYAKNIDDADFKQYLEELAQNEKDYSKAQQSTNESGQRVIFQGLSKRYHVLRYQILGGVFALLGIYLLYRGDARYSTSVLVPALAFACYFVQKQNTARRAIPIVRQILQNNDKSLEVFVETQNIISRISNVNSVKLAGGKCDFQVPFGWATADGYLVKVNGQQAVLPFNFTGNTLELKKILSQ